MSFATLRRSIPPNVDAAVMHALEKLPADRVATAREFAAALEAGAAPSRTTTVSSRTVGRARSRLADPVVWALAVVAIGALAARGWQSASARRARPQPVIRFAVEIPRDQTLSGFGLLGPTIAVAPDGNGVAFLTTSPGGTRQIMLRSSGDSAARTLPFTEGARQPFFSPDGRWIAFWALGRLHMIGVDGGARQTIAEMPEYVGATWVSRELIVFSDGGRLFSLATTGGPRRELTSPDTARGETRQIYPVGVGDEDHVLYSSSGTGGNDSLKVGIASISSRRATILAVPAVTPLGVVDDQLIAVSVNNGIIAAPIDIAGERVTGPPVPITDGVAVGATGIAKAAVSSGTLAFVSGAQESEVILVDATGSTRTTQTVLGERRTYGFPRYSPDGHRIALSIASGVARDVWIYDIALRTSTRLTTGSVVNERPEWTPDGKRLVYRTDRGPRSSIWSQPVDMSAPATPLLSGGRGAFFEAIFTPDGKAVVYQVDTTGADIEYRLLEGDTQPRPVATTPAFENSPRLSPNGRWIAFVTDESGIPQVVVQPFPGPGPKLQVSTNGTEPVWSRDGQRLFYRGGGKVMVANLVTAPNLAVTSRKELFDDVFVPATSPHANYDVSPDGTNLLMLKAVTEQRLIVVHNWDTELRERLRPRSQQR